MCRNALDTYEIYQISIRQNKARKTLFIMSSLFNAVDTSDSDFRLCDRKGTTKK